MPTGFKLLIKPGDQYGRLSIVKEIVTKERGRMFLCKCSCGKEKVIRLNDLTSGRIKSCGCLLREASRNRLLRHGQSDTRLYTIWHKMKDRCLNPNNQDYNYYGGRGITLHDNWIDFKNFYDWAMVNGYNEDLTIDRIDVHGNYEPGNCKWATRQEQSDNTRANINICFNGETKNLKKWAKDLGFKYTTLYRRIIIKGWPIEKALTTPTKSKEAV